MQINEQNMDIIDDQFQQLDMNENVVNQVMQSVIRPRPEEVKPKTNYKVSISLDQSQNEKNILQNQYYTVSVFKDSKEIKKVPNRRFSDFDMLFQILFRQYKGCILPAFPENGILSYVKSKVSLTKDDKFLKQRICMVERFLTILLNNQKFGQSCPQIQSFLSQKLFDLFKSREKQKSQGIITSSFNKFINYIKFGQQAGKQRIQKLQQEKKSFQQLYQQIKSIISLLEQQKKQNKILQQKKLVVKDIDKYLDRVLKVDLQQQQNLRQLRKIQFEVYCQNEDYEMAIKQVKYLQNMKNDQKCTNQVIKQAQLVFSTQLTNFKKAKSESLKKSQNLYKQILKNISKTDFKF